jgi:hypothetical protein
MDEDKKAATMSGDKPLSGGGAGNGHRQLGEKAKETAEHAIGQTRGMAHQLFGDVREAAEEMLDERKERAADSVHGVADALRRTAGNLKGENEAIARYAEQAADTVARFSDTVRERRFGDMIADLDDFARRQPTLFLVGAVAAGFIAGRFMAASAERQEPAWRVARRKADRHRAGPAAPSTAGYGDFGARGGT